MPKLSALKLDVLEDLASQLRFVPTGRTIEQLGQIVALASEVDATQLYPEDWLIQRITGYRPEIDEPAMIVGGALVAGLSALAERLSDQARLERDALLGVTLSLDELAARWSVSGRTIERYRRDGLIAVRVRSKGRSRLAFPVESVEAYERANTKAIGAARERTRIGRDDRRRLVGLAARSQRRFGWSLNEAARRLAMREGRSHEGIRQVLLKAGGGRSAMGRGDRRRRVMLRAVRVGATVAQLAEKYEKSPASVRRILNEERSAILREALKELRSAGAVDAIGEAIGEAPDDAEMWQLLESSAARWGLRAPMARTAGEFVAAARSTTPPTKTEEQATAAALRLLVCRVDRRVRFGGSSRLAAGAIDAAQTDLRWATLLTAKLVRSQRGFLLKAIEARLERPVLELPAELIRSAHRETMDAAIAAAWRFDPAKGGRLAATTGLAVDRSLARWLKVCGADVPVGGGRARAVGASVVDWTGRLGSWQRWLDPDRRLADWTGERHSSESYATTESGATGERRALAREAVGLRYGLLGEPPMTRRAVAERLGLSQRRLGAMLREAPEMVRRVGRI